MVDIFGGNQKYIDLWKKDLEEEEIWQKKD
jgi:hypothetical protein